MLVSKSIVSLFAVVMAGTGAALTWQVRTHVALESHTVRAPTDAELRTLEQEVATQRRRLSDAEGRLSALLKAADTTRAARVQSGSASAPANTAAASASRDGAIDIYEVAKAATDKGRALMKEGKSQQALDLYLATYREVRPLRPGSPACQRITSEMKYLGRTFPPALAALGQLRDDALRQFQAQPARQGELSFEVALLNDRLGQADRTLALFDALPPDDIQRRSLAMVARDAFIEARRYNDALLGKSFGQMLTTVDASAQHLSQETDPARQAMLRKSVVEQTIANIEVLAGAGKSAEAEQLTKKLLAFDDSATTRQALEQHLSRAAGDNR